MNFVTQHQSRAGRVNRQTFGTSSVGVYCSNAYPRVQNLVSPITGVRAVLLHILVALWRGLKPLRKASTMNCGLSQYTAPKLVQGEHLWGNLRDVFFACCRRQVEVATSATGQPATVVA